MRLLRSIFLLAFLVNAAFANIEDHVVPIRHAGINWLPPGVKLQYGSGICIDRACSIVATAYHAQLLAHSRNLKVVGGHVRKTAAYPAETDSNKAKVRVGRGHFYYDLSKDITFLYTTKPIAHKKGVQYSFSCDVGQEVTIVGTHSDAGGQQRARIVGVNAPLRLNGSAINENVIVDVALKPGDSGSAVFDKSGRLLGMIIMVGQIVTKRGPLRVSVALPVSTIARALRELDPAAASIVFSDIPQDQVPRAVSTWINMGAGDFESVDDESESGEMAEVMLPTIENLPRLNGNLSDPVQKLRAKADTASKLMNNLLATECLLSKTRRCYEVSVSQGDQQYREIKKDGKRGPFTKEPFRGRGTPRSLWDESSWLDAIASVAEIPWTFEGSLGSGYVFSGRGRAEDERCSFRESPGSIPIFQLPHPEWEGSVGCLEILFTNSDFDVLSLYTEFYPPPDCLTERMDMVIQYQWVRLPDIDEPMLLPIKERLSARVRGQKQPMFATVLWFDYRVFRADHKIMF